MAERKNVSRIAFGRGLGSLCLPSVGSLGYYKTLQAIGDDFLSTMGARIMGLGTNDKAGMVLATHCSNGLIFRSIHPRNAKMLENWLRPNFSNGRGHRKIWEICISDGFIVFSVQKCIKWEGMHVDSEEKCTNRTTLLDRPADGRQQSTTTL